MKVSAEPRFGDPQDKDVGQYKQGPDLETEPLSLQVGHNLPGRCPLPALNQNEPPPPPSSPSPKTPKHSDQVALPAVTFVLLPPPPPNRSLNDNSFGQSSHKRLHITWSSVASVYTHHLLEYHQLAAHELPSPLVLYTTISLLSIHHVTNSRYYQITISAAHHVAPLSAIEHNTATLVHHQMTATDILYHHHTT